MKSLFLIDPLETILPKIQKDSSSQLMETGLARGHEIFVATVHDLLLRQSGLGIRCRNVLSVTTSEHSNAPSTLAPLAAPEPAGFDLGEEADVDAGSFDVIWLRKNPPFDETYFMHLELFDQLSHSYPRVFFINHPRIIRDVNEKLCIFDFPEFITDTIVTMDLQTIRSFWKSHGTIVVKGLTGFGGDSVVMIESWDRDFPKLEALSNGGSRFLMAQVFLKNIYQGDKRVTLVEGKILNVFSRVPAENSFLAYTGAGATVHESTLTSREETIIKAVGNYARTHGVFLAGVDLIDGFLMEINLTSPSFFAQANREMNLKSDQIIWERVEANMTSP